MEDEIKQKRMEHIRGLLETIPNENPEREGLLKTPDRVARMYEEIFSGYGKNPADVFQSVFTSDFDQMVVVRSIDYYSQCEHHIVSFFGQVAIGYIPNGKVLGLSKFTRLVEIYARRLQIQEQMTFQITDAIEKYLQPKGVIVVVTGKHLCMCSRGVQKINSETVTSDVRGAFRTDDKVRKEFFNLIQIGV